MEFFIVVSGGVYVYMPRVTWVLGIWMDCSWYATRGFMLLSHLGIFMFARAQTPIHGYTLQQHTFLIPFRPGPCFNVIRCRKFHGISNTHKTTPSYLIGAPISYQNFLVGLRQFPLLGFVYSMPRTACISWNVCSFVLTYASRMKLTHFQ